MAFAAWAGFAVVVALAVAWVVVFDGFVGAAWLHPLGWGFALAPVTLLAACSWTLSRSRAVRWGSGGAVLLAVLVVLAPWNARKRFVDDLFSVQQGMSVDDVEARLGRYHRGPGAKWRVPPEPESAKRDADDRDDPNDPHDPEGIARRPFTGTRTYRWSTAAQYDSDWGQVRFVNGRVVHVAFLPD
jgi:hypothetical protein